MQENARVFSLYVTPASGQSLWNIKHIVIYPSHLSTLHLLWWTVSCFMLTWMLYASFVGIVLFLWEQNGQLSSFLLLIL